MVLGLFAMALAGNAVAEKKEVDVTILGKHYHYMRSDVCTKICEDNIKLLEKIQKNFHEDTLQIRSMKSMKKTDFCYVNDEKTNELKTEIPPKK